MAEAIGGHRLRCLLERCVGRYGHRVRGEEISHVQVLWSSARCDTVEHVPLGYYPGTRAVGLRLDDRRADVPLGHPPSRFRYRLLRSHREDVCAHHLAYAHRILYWHDSSFSIPANNPAAATVLAPPSAATARVFPAGLASLLPPRSSRRAGGRR